jgi:hypothetical protein
MIHYLLMAYTAFGCFFIASQYRTWMVNFDRYNRQNGPGVLLAFVLEVIFDVAFWPLFFWVWLRQRLAEAYRVRCMAVMEKELRAASERMAGCPHVRCTLVDVGEDGCALPTVKCRDCWALQIDGNWFANCAPPPETDRTPETTR